MCGRFSIVATLSDILKRFEIENNNDIIFNPVYNAAPSQILPVISNDASESLSLFKWGFIPHWAKERSIGNKMINARAETLLEKPSFKSAFVRKRCLILCDGFYEWNKTSKEKEPYRITLISKELFSFAGLWDEWRDKESGDIIRSFVIITTNANDLVGKIHNRMPVILRKEDEKRWLAEGLSKEEYTRAYPSEEMSIYRVSHLVNSPKNNTIEVIKPFHEN